MTWPERGLGAAWAAAIVAALTASPASGQTTATISVDATTPGGPLRRIWAYHGYDEVNSTTTVAGRELLATLGALHAGSPYIRSHFLLNSDDGPPGLKWGSTNLYSEDAAGDPVFDFATVDQIMDTLIVTGTRPLVEIGFMPRDLSVNPEPYRNSFTYGLDGGCFYPPDDYDKWRAAVRAWAEHVNQRYDAVQSTWQWELWNEPDIGYWRGTFEEFTLLYDVTEAALHDVLPNAELGGPDVADAGGSFLPQFLEHCATGTNAVSGATGTRLDIVTFHAKGGVGLLEDQVQMDLGSQLRQHRSGMNAVAAVPTLRHAPIIVSEADPDGCAACPADRNPANAYRNSSAYGAYVVAMMKRSLELADRIGVDLRGVLTWAFLFEDVPYFSGYRALETNGIHLPVLNAFKLLGALEGARVPVVSSAARPLDEILEASVRQEPDIDAIAVRDGGYVRVLVYHYHDDLGDTEPSPVHLEVELPADFVSPARVTHVRVDEAHGNAHTVWVSQGSPVAPSAEQIDELRAAMDPVAIEPARDVDVTDGIFVHEFDLPRFGISLVTLTSANVVGNPRGSGRGPGGVSRGGEAGSESAGCGCRIGTASHARWGALGVLVALGCAGAIRRRVR